MNNKIKQVERYVKGVLKRKMAVTEGLLVAFMIAGFFGLNLDSKAAWVEKDQIKNYIQYDGDGKFIIAADNNRHKALNGAVLIGNADNKIKVPLGDSVVLSSSAEIDVETPIDLVEKPTNRLITSYNKGIVALGNVKISSNPYGLGRTGTGGQAIAIGDFATSTSQSVAIGSDTYSVGGSSIAIGGDDIASYRDNITKYDYDNYFKALYDKIGTYNAGSIYSPNVAGGEGSISIGARTVAYNPGSTALGTLAYALGKGATALGTQSRAEGEGSIAIGNLTRNFANQALAIGNDSQILNTGGTAVGLRARAGGEGSIAIGTDVYSNAAMNNNSGSGMNTKHNDLKNRGMGTDKLETIENIIVDKNTISPAFRSHHGISDIISESGKNSLVIGTRSAALGSNSIALGRGAFAMSDNSFGIGSYSYADKKNSIAIGTSSRALAENAITLGAGSVTMTGAENSTVIGTRSAVAGEKSSIVGSDSEIFGSNSLIFGNTTRIYKKGNAASDNNIAIGNEINIASGVTNSMAYGAGSKIGDKDTNNNEISNATAFGVNATVSRQYTGVTVDKMDSTEIKTKAAEDPKFMYTGKNTMAIGNNSVATLENSVALGVGSSTDYTYADLLKPGWTAQDSIAIPTSGQTGVISVGSKGAERRIVNVASGSRDTDAVNVIQLKTLEEKIDGRVNGIESGMHYLSINKQGVESGNEKGSKAVTELVERRKNYDLYLRYKTQELQIKAREKWRGEKFDEVSKNKITAELAKIEKADTSGEIKKAAKKLIDIDIPGITTDENSEDKYKELVAKIEKINKELTTEEKYRELIGGIDIKALENGLFVKSC